MNERVFVRECVGFFVCFQSGIRPGWEVFRYASLDKFLNPPSLSSFVCKIVCIFFLINEVDVNLK